MNVKSLFPSRWVSADDLGTRRVEVTISGCALETVRDFRTGENVQKMAISFAGATKKLLPNKTQCFKIAEIAGSYETDNWVGVKISMRVGQAHNRKPTIIIEKPAVQTPAEQLNHGAADA